MEKKIIKYKMVVNNHEEFLSVFIYNQLHPEKKEWFIPVYEEEIDDDKLYDALAERCGLMKTTSGFWVNNSWIRFQLTKYGFRCMEKEESHD